jgi:8-oxo-dGTP pyrophosphatase MutT (NUDIX family)
VQSSIFFVIRYFVSELISQLRQRLRQYRPVDRWTDPSQYQGEAAVLIAVTDSPAPEVILTKRSEKLSSHRGEVALPGGRIDAQDESVVHAALRESHEEIGLESSLVEVLGQLDPMVTRFGMKVTPVVGIVPEAIVLTPSPHELDAVFKVPLEFLLRDQRLRTDIGIVGGHKVEVPCWRYHSYEIWGVTAVILTMLMNKVYDRGINTGMEQIEKLSSGKWQPQDWREVEGKKGIVD